MNVGDGKQKVGATRAEYGGSKHETSRDDGSNAAATATANGKLPNDDAAATAANANAAGTTE